jgi:RNA polymerase sigma-70 factor (ECF subfamily)
MTDPPAGPPPGGPFPTRRWSRIAAAGDAPDALAELCDAYWYPIYAFIRRAGHDADAALDLTQGYFARLLERRPFEAADPSRGRFRAFLLADCRHFLAHRREHDHARRRGGGRRPLPIDAHDAEGRYHPEPSHDRTAARLFERDWHSPCWRTSSPTCAASTSAPAGGPPSRRSRAR